MEEIGRTCLNCESALGPNARFCPKCGQPAGLAARGPLPGGPPPGPPGGPGPGPGFGEGLGFADGPGYTMVPPPAQAPPPGWGAPAGAEWGEPTRGEWGEPTVTRPALPYQAPMPPPVRPQDPPYPPPAYDRPPDGQAPREAQGFGSFWPYPPQRQAGGQPPLGPPSQPFQGPPRQPPRRHDGDRSSTSAALWVILLVIVLGGGAAAGLLIAHPFSHPSIRQTASTGAKPTAPTGAGSGTAASPAASSATSQAASPAASTSASAATGQQAAATVAAMLQRSVSDRAAIKTAYDEVLACDPKMASAPQVFTSAATSRQQLLTSLGTMPGRAALPPALLSDLTQAWQASIAADQAFAQWANDELANCTPNDTGSAAYQATVTPDNNATKYKTLFVARWNPLAAKYGLTQYQQGQL